MYSKYKYGNPLNTNSKNGPVVSYIDSTILGQFKNNKPHSFKLKEVKHWDYEEYINSKEWLNKKEEYFKVFTKQCKICGSYELLQVHHLSYDRLGKELLFDLMCLCKTCHEKIHKYHKSTKLSLYQASWRFYYRNRKVNKIKK